MFVNWQKHKKNCFLMCKIVPIMYKSKTKSMSRILSHIRRTSKRSNKIMSLTFHELVQGYSTTFSKGPDSAGKKSLDSRKLRKFGKLRSRIYGKQILVKDPNKIEAQKALENQTKKSSPYLKT